jgi:hypothetical protein
MSASDMSVMFSSSSLVSFMDQFMRYSVSMFFSVVSCMSGMSMDSSA